jgi:RNA polymerase sigma-70 factor (ECF subfamily)
MTIDDKTPELLDGLRRGDASSAEELYHRFGPAIRAAVRRRLHHRLRDKFDSLDFVQDVWASYLALPPERAAFDSPEEAVRFLTRIAENKVIEVFRQRFQSQKYDIARERPGATGPEPPGADPTPSQTAIAREEWERLLDRVPPGHRPVVERLRNGDTYEDIARITNLSVSTVNRIVRRLKGLTEH